MRTNHVLRVLVVLLLFVVQLAWSAGQQEGEGDGATEPATLRFTVFSGSGAHHAMLEGMFDGFLDAEPSVADVQLDVIPPAEYPQKIAVQLAGGNPPDAGWLPLTEVALFAGEGALADIGPTLRGDREYDFDDIIAAAFAPWMTGDAVYGVPFSTSPFFIVYNVDKFAAAGVETPRELHATGNWTWPKFREIAARVQATLPSGQYVFQHFGQSGAPTYNDPYRSLFQLIRAYGGRFFSEDLTECMLDDPATVEALALYHGMVFDDGSATPPGEVSDFYAGQAAMVGAQVSRIAPLATADYEWDAVPMPAGPDGRVVQYFGQSAIVVFRASPNVESAALLVKHLTNKENVLTMTEFFPPARESVLNAEEFVAGHPILSRQQMEELIRDGIRNGEAFLTPPTFAQLRLRAETVWDELWTEGADIPAVAEQLSAVIQPFLGR